MASHNSSRGGGAGQKNKKHKKSFLYKARKFGSRGLFGRGKNVDEETYNYFVRVFERLKDDFEDDEEKDIFINNVFEQTKDKEMDLMCNQVISKVIEKLLPLAGSATLQHYSRIMQKEMRIICTDPYASHVLETAMGICMDTLNNSKGTADHQAFCKEWLCSICRYAFNNVEDFVGDIYASHILRTSMHLMSGVEVDIMTMKSYRSRRHMDAEQSSTTPNHKCPEFLNILKDFGEMFTAWPQLPDLIHSNDSSAVIQTALYCLHSAHPQLCNKLLNALTNDILPTLSSVWDSASTVHVLEACLTVADDKTFSGLHQSYFKGHVKSLAETFETRFSVTKLLESVNDKELLAEIFEELAPFMEDIFAAGSGTVVLALANSCRRLATLQAKFLEHLMQTFHCFDPEPRQAKIVPLVSRLMTYDVAYGQEKEEDADKKQFPVHFIGSQIVQALLHFRKPIKIVGSLLAMDCSELRDLLVDPAGSHIMDAFVSADFVGEKSREKLVDKLQGSYFTLATSKNGSRSLDALWRSSEVKMRQVIAEELLQKESALQSNLFGRIIMENYALALLKRQKADWRAVQEKDGKKRKLFAGLIETAKGEDSSAPQERQAKKKKKKGSS